MRILFALIDMHLGGTEKSLLNLLNTLNEDVEVTILLMRRHGELLNAIPPGVKVKVIEHSEEIFHIVESNFIALTKEYFTQRKPLKALRALSYYVRSKKQKNIDCYYEFVADYLPEMSSEYDVAVAYAGPNTFISNYILHKTTARQKIQWVHFDVSQIYFDVLMNKPLFAGFDQVLCVSKDVQDHLLTAIPEIAHKTSVRYNVIPYALINTLAQEQATGMDPLKRNKIVTVGRLSKEKGHIGFLETFRKLKEDGNEFVWYIVGDGACRAALQQEINAMGLNENVVLLGKQINPYPYIKEADIYLQPSHYEGHCVTILEAKYLCRPIICTDFSGAKDELEHLHNGLITSFDEDDKLRQMNRILNDEHLRQQFEHVLSLQRMQSEITTVAPFWEIPDA